MNLKNGDEGRYDVQNVLCIDSVYRFGISVYLNDATNSCEGRRKALAKSTVHLDPAEGFETCDSVGLPARACQQRF